jgi:hypothetical protein
MTVAAGGDGCFTALYRVPDVLQVIGRREVFARLAEGSFPNISGPAAEIYFSRAVGTLPGLGKVCHN